MPTSMIASPTRRRARSSAACLIGGRHSTRSHHDDVVRDLEHAWQRHLADLGACGLDHGVVAGVVDRSVREILGLRAGSQDPVAVAGDGPDPVIPAGRSPVPRAPGRQPRLAGPRSAARRTQRRPRGPRDDASGPHVVHVRMPRSFACDCARLPARLFDSHHSIVEGRTNRGLDRVHRDTARSPRCVCTRSSPCWAWPPGPPTPNLPKAVTYADEIRTLYRIAACGGDDAIADKYSTRTVVAHCKEMDAVYKSYKKEWSDQAEAFIGDLRPRDIPKTVVYPFGGGDLTSALTVFPDASEITTISLEGRRRRPRGRHDQGGHARDRPRQHQLRDPPVVPVGALDDEVVAGGVAFDDPPAR